MTEQQTDIDQAVALLAAAIGEHEASALEQLRTLISVKGLRFAQDVLEQTHQKEAAGGMLTADKSRRRTFGGVFFALARRNCSSKEHAQIWPGHAQPRRPGRRSTNPHKKPEENHDSAVPWENRTQVYQTLTETGKGRMKVTIIGRPGKIAHQGNYVITVMQDGIPPSLPRGLPPLPDAPNKYAVLIARKQWDGVAQALQSSADDQLIIEGHAAFDDKLPGMVIYATRAITKAQQTAARAAAQREA